MKRIAELRKENRLNQIGLGLKLNVSQKMISSYENGTHQPSIDTLIQMSDLFNVSVDYIIGKSDIRYSAENFIKDNLTEKEAEMLNIFKTLSKNKQEQAIGILFALQNIK